MRKSFGRVIGTRRFGTKVRSALVMSAAASFGLVDAAQAEEPPAPAAVDLDEESSAGGEEAPSDDPAEVALEDDASADSGESGSESSEASSSGDARPSPLDIMPGLRLYSRAFRYTGTINQIDARVADPLTDYNLDIGPMPFINLHWYPLAHVMGGVPAHIGITGGYEMGIATKVSYVDPVTTEERTLNQSHSLWYVGLRGRIPVSVLTIGLGANYGNHSFSLKDSVSGAPSLFPNVSYAHIEAGGDIEARVGSMIFGAQASYLYLMSAGDLVSDEWFATASGRGVHLGAHVGWGAASFVDLLAGVDARAYGFDFNPIPEDAPPERVAGGATDRYMSFWLGARFRIPENTGSGSASAGGGGVEAEGSFDSFDSFD